MKGEETKLRNDILKALRDEFPNGYFFHIHGNPFQPSGLPDIVGCLNGRYIGMEVKCQGKDESKIQAFVRKETQIARGLAKVIYSVEEGLKLSRLAIATSKFCHYCSRQFGMPVSRGYKTIILRKTVDHVIPFVYSQDDTKGNKVPCCHICNALKRDILFDSVSLARVYLKKRWIAKKFSDIESVLQESNTELPEGN